MWSSECQAAKLLKDKLTSAPVLKFPDFLLPDASDVGLFHAER